jgi:hypothetical protein
MGERDAAGIIRQVQESTDEINRCAEAVIGALRPFTPRARILALEMVHAIAVVRDSDYTPSRHKQRALESFGFELDSFYEQHRSKQGATK